MESAGNLKKEKNNIEQMAICEISDHIKNNKNLLKIDEEFGYYLAGLIEGNGKLNLNSIEIKYNKNDIQAAYWLKKRIGAGKVLKNKENYKYKLENIKALEFILHLINGKFLTNSKIKEWKEISKEEYIEKPFLFKNTYFLTGYFEAKGNLNIKNEATYGCELECIIEDTWIILDKLKYEFEGNIIHSLDGYIYTSSSFISAKSFIDYFDKYNIVSMKYIEYLKWRDCYRIIQRNEHLTEKGLNKIDKLKNSLLDIRSSYSF